MPQTMMATLPEILEKYTPAFLEKLEWHCNAYKLVGSGTFESPMWLQYRGCPDVSDENLIEFASSQVSISFTLQVDPEDIRYFHGGTYHTVYNYFRNKKYTYIREQHPTIYKEIKI